MVEKGISEATQLAYREKDEAVSPLGDFIAQLGAAIAAIFVFTSFYTNTATGDVVKGYESPYGIIILVAAALTFIFTTTVLWFKFGKRDFWMRRSPGWAYATAAFVVIVVTVLALAFPRAGYDLNWGTLFMELFIGLNLLLAGMFKF
jgi:hypothetical protein